MYACTYIYIHIYTIKSMHFSYRILQLDFELFQTKSLVTIFLNIII